MIASMFENGLADHWEPPATSASRELLSDLAAHQRRENQACARRLRIIAELFGMRLGERGENADWAVDTWAAVGAEVAAALRISLGKAGSYLSYGLAMERLPAVAAAFDSGDIDMTVYRTIVYRTGLITDAAVMAQVDQIVAARAARWPSMTQGRLIREIDRVVARVDPDAVRRVRERARDRDVTVWDGRDGTAEISGLLLSTDAYLLDKRLDELARTVCEADPRTVAQRRADALGALAGGAERLMCACGTAECASTAATPSPIVIHVVAEAATLEGRSDSPGYLLGADDLIPAELLRDLAKTAKRRPLIGSAEMAAEPHYRPSRALADFVRARDLTCRAPGCDRPATQCDLDHTIPYPQGATHASNIKALCRLHHLLKTFWGWRDTQLPDGTVIWNLPNGATYVTTPGSALLFPSLSVPTGPLPASAEHVPERGSAHMAHRSAMMPTRTKTRRQHRAHRISAERSRNRQQRQARYAACYGTAPPADSGSDPPPF